MERDAEDECQLRASPLDLGRLPDQNRKDDLGLLDLTPILVSSALTPISGITTVLVSSGIPPIVMFSTDMS